MKNKFVTIEIDLNVFELNASIKTSKLSVVKWNKFIHISNDNSVEVQSLSAIENPVEFSKRNKGILISAGTEIVTIFNDPFCSIPLYYYRDANRVIITSEPSELFDRVDSQIDEAGMWEIILFGSCVWNRTLFKSLSQMPSATKLLVTKNNLDLNRYWNFSVQEDPYLRSTKNSIEALDSKLSEIFAALPAKPLLMGMSGGMDSRVSAAYLHKVNKNSITDTFTYASTKFSLEYKYAKQVCDSHNISSPKLCLLNEASYRGFLGTLPKYTCGQIGIQHSHISSILNNYAGDVSVSYTQVSNYYSDAVFGWDCTGTKNIVDGSDSLSKVLESSSFVPVKVKAEIESDIYHVFLGLDQDSNISSLDEFKYMTERHQKFHMNLAFQQSRLVDTLTPYANHDLLVLMLSMPLHLRKRKNILDLLFESGCIKNSLVENISSRQLLAGNEFPDKGLMSWIHKYEIG